ncbi:MAG: bifunctional 23S rRNA (guanine(2069)-N(7))-methyltransferase RlmK/23S rRNA (guanine(2445)-N(2))-methyltransferase RlmL, partial [Gammaproteobacteria bacterium]|nr:bifunctional 23S rRNA (guanine(2069)-N(7))-methyltransferase RlmK/23S rRNA (guanine(2445)-N(2))-methyltransferase RlmL [Gammaproteobacteria bacterium]
MNLQFRAICPKGLEGLLQTELQSLGAEATRESPGSVYFDGPMTVAYRACLWSRLANRILYPLAAADVSTPKELYDMVMTVDWGMHFDVKKSFRVDFRGTSSQLNNEPFNAMKVKDAIVDQFREETGQRPNIDLKNPDIWLHTQLHKGKCHISIDLSGPSLHQRGYRIAQGAAPIKENLAAALLIRAGWPEMASDKALIDPLCGSGTLILEGLLMRADIAPGLFREHYGFNDWLPHDDALWQELLNEAQDRRKIGLAALENKFLGYEVDRKTVRAAQANVGRLGFEDYVTIKALSFEEAANELPSGLFISNPPYGERLGDYQSLIPLYESLGRWLKKQTGSTAAIICSEPELVRTTAIHAHKRYKFFNGKLPCQLYCFDLNEDNYIKPFKQPSENPKLQPLYNRIQKNRKKLKSWLKQQDVEVYRIYDHDLPEYAFSIDLYADEVVIYETKAPATVKEDIVKRHRHDMLLVLAEIFNKKPADMILKSRQRQKGSDQYGKRDNSRDFMTVAEQGLKFRVNLYDYLDTGLFADHRKIRDYIRKQSNSKSFLNLFCYTATASVYAAAGGAEKTVSVDLSNTYLNWAKENLKLNGFDQKQHEIIKADCLSWLKQCTERFDLVFLDPPSFSNSKSMDTTFDVQRDHSGLIYSTMSCVKPDGQLIFSTNRNKFKLDAELCEKYDIQDQGKATLSPDFRSHRAPHFCWFIKHKS